jgi:hypothetical protein
MTTEKQLDDAMQKVLVQVLKAAKDYSNNPDKAHEYIVRKVNAIYIAGKEMGKQSVLDDLFNGPAE